MFKKILLATVIAGTLAQAQAAQVLKKENRPPLALLGAAALGYGYSHCATCTNWPLHAFLNSNTGSSLIKVTAVVGGAWLVGNLYKQRNQVVRAVIQEKAQQNN